MTRRPAVALAALALLAAAPAARAADWSFDPSFVLGVQYNTNVLLVSDPADPQTLGDTIGVFSAALPLTATTPRSSTSLSFLLTWYEYGSKEYTSPLPDAVPGGANLSDLSYGSYAATLAWTLTQSPRTSWQAAAYGMRSDRQGVSFDNVKQDLVVLPPTTTTSWTASGTGTFRLSERAAWIVNAGTSGTYYDSNRFNDQGGAITVENTTTTTLGLASESRLSPQSRLQVGYLGQYIDSGAFGADLVQNLWAGYLYGEATEGWQFTGRAGVAWLKTADRGDPAFFAPDPLPPSQDEVKPVFQFLASRNVLKRSVVDLGVSQEYAGSNGIEGTSMVLAAFTGLRVPIRQYSRFGLAARYSDRNPVAAGSPDTRTFGGNAEYVAGLSPRWALGFGAQYYDQTSSSTPLDGTSATPVADGRYSIFSAVVSWSPTNR